MNDELTYEQWLVEIDRLLFRRYGITRTDLADTVFLVDAYEAEESPADVVAELLAGDDLGALMLDDENTEK